ncbi:prephenate dehydratase [Anaerobacillus alkalidiazotrophicus]|uniref:Prephenate dehydratase n=1 Tax=Anaerobacillus alkalidiazotrophicus TaxID=472963 RepID=A0A1S2ME27_9BACI|nr:prephenate dehydratase [Anaerobacillus alkalidiazotrophicus]OIJ21945.1 prephenate dehydratase [Anaerobacillus alkalidiazotrophicus]
MNKIAYLGPKGTFTEMATISVFPSDERIPFRTIPDCMDAVSKNIVDFAVVPIENTIEGSVNLTLDYLIHNQKLLINGEITVPIEQQLLIHSNNIKNWTAIKKVYSHPHAIAQCHKFLRSLLPDAEFEYTNSTGSAADYVAQNPDQPIAAIANELAAKEYNLVVAEKNIHDYENNHTRFVILKNESSSMPESPSHYIGDKTTLMVTLPADYPGALHHVLSAFAWRKLNLSKIESRPMKTGLGNYFFVIDVAMKMDEVLIPGVIAELEALKCQVTLLGSYPCYSLSKKVDEIRVET